MRPFAGFWVPRARVEILPGVDWPLLREILPIRQEHAHGEIIFAMKNDSAKKPRQSVVSAKQKKINVSAGVIAGNKLGGATPQYPAISKAATTENKGKK